MKKKILFLSTILLVTVLFGMSKSNAQPMPGSQLPAAPPTTTNTNPPQNTVLPPPGQAVTQPPIITDEIAACIKELLNDYDYYPDLGPYARALLAQRDCSTDPNITTDKDCVKELLNNSKFHPDLSPNVRELLAKKICIPLPPPKPRPSSSPYISDLEKCANDLLNNASTCSDAPCNGYEQQAGCGTSFPSGACCCSSLEGAEKRRSGAIMECYWNGVVEQNK